MNPTNATTAKPPAPAPAPAGGLKVFTQVRKSPVLLVVIYNKNNLTFEPDHIYEVFCKYGLITKVLIFEKGPLTKAFVEYDTVHAASEAKAQMEGKCTLKDGTKINVFYANIDQIVFKNDSSCGKEYVVGPPGLTKPDGVSSPAPVPKPQKAGIDPSLVHQIECLNLSDHPEKEGPETDEMYINKFLESSLRENLVVNFPPAFRADASAFKPPGPSSLFSSQSYLPGNNSLKAVAAPFASEKVMGGTQNEAKTAEYRSEGASIKSFTNNTDEIRENLSDMGSNTYITVGDNKYNATLNTEHKSPIIYVKGFDPDMTNVLMIYNIFSNFGNILKIAFVRAKGCALIEYETVIYATIARDSLNNMMFLGAPLKVFLSSPDTPAGKGKFTPEDAGEEEIFIGQADKTHRYKVNKKISINPPSEILHISNLLIQYCTDDIIKNLFAPYGTIEGIKFIFMENNRNMCLIKFATLEESFWAMANLHNHDVGGRKIQISFTRSKL